MTGGEDGIARVWSVYFPNGCPDAGGFSGCAYVKYLNATIAYTPEWRWNPNCPDIFVDNYGPVFMLMMCCNVGLVAVELLTVSRLWRRNRCCWQRRAKTPGLMYMYYDAILGVAVCLLIGFLYPPVAILGAATNLALWKGRALVLQRRVWLRSEGTRPPSAVPLLMCGGVMWLGVVLVFSTRVISGNLENLGVIVTMSLSMCAAVYRWWRSGTEMSTDAMDAALMEHSNVSAELDALAAAFSEYQAGLS